MAARRRIFIFSSAVLFTAVWLAPAFGADPAFTADQVAKGRAQYGAHCASCHGAKLEGEHLSPPLVGARFDASFRGKTVGALSFHLRRMPPEPVDNPGGLGDEVYSAVLAHILAANGIEAGEEAMPADLDAVADVRIPRLAGSTYDPLAPAEGAAGSEVLAKLSPVTQEALREPSPDDWLHTSRTYDAQSFSPLKQIDRDSVKYMALAWRAPLNEGMAMPMPIVYQGIMFLQAFPDTVVALDASNGQVLWRYRHRPQGPASQKMGLALHGDKVLVPTSDLHVLALRAKTGELIWDHEIRKESEAAGRGGYQLRSAPLVVGDKVIQGITASFVPKGGFLVAIDIESGEEAWRFHTIARPGTPFGESWNDVPIERRSGGSIWHQGTYDPELNLVYYGVAPTYDTGPLVHPVDKEGVTSDALYTNCTIALNADTGELVWHYQHMANDQWDLDWVFERQIVDVEVDGETRRAVVNVGKMAILEAVDAATGEYLFSVDSGIQNVITAIDPETGAKTIDPERWPDPERPTDICPSAFGARSWPPTAYSPQTGLAYLPLTESCMNLGKKGSPLLTSGVFIGPATHPDSADGKIGRLQAVDLAGQKLAWRQDLSGAISTGMLATAGGLVFSGDSDPSLKAFHDTTGELLWEAKLDAMPSSGLLTYKIGATQYVAVVVGVNNFHVQAFRGTLLAGGGATGVLDPKKQAKGGPAVWVFSL
jgi:alcohol dehydrogenase (cytochrome c)